MIATSARKCGGRLSARQQVGWIRSCKAIFFVVGHVELAVVDVHMSRVALVVIERDHACCWFSVVSPVRVVSVRLFDHTCVDGHPAALHFSVVAVANTNEQDSVAVFHLNEALFRRIQRGKSGDLATSDKPAIRCEQVCIRQLLRFTILPEDSRNHLLPKLGRCDAQLG